MWCLSMGHVVFDGVCVDSGFYLPFLPERNVYSLLSKRISIYLNKFRVLLSFKIFKFLFSSLKTTMVKMERAKSCLILLKKVLKGRERHLL